jgi:hypothetical protein
MTSNLGFIALYYLTNSLIGQLFFVSTRACFLKHLGSGLCNRHIEFAAQHGYGQTQ